MARRFVMEFERPLAELEDKLEKLRRLDISEQPELAAEIDELAAEIEELRSTLYAALTPWERVQVSRHPDRPKTADYLENLFSDVVELHGDRQFADDEAIWAGFATLGDRRFALIGHNKGSNTKENVERNFGSPHPEGFRKARRIMQLSDRFSIPLVTLLDTAGAYPGIEDEARGQAWAIAECLATLADVRAPVVVVGIGEGGSGGALAIGFGDRMLMLENAYYSVISPEMCAQILHKDAAKACETAQPLQMTAEDLKRLGIIDEVLPEAPGGAHRRPEYAYEVVGEALGKALDELAGTPVGELVQKRYERLRAVGVYTE